VKERFQQELDRLGGDDSLPKTILAVSGGIDSVVMAYLYQQSEVSYSIAHCNFQLRGKESEKDEEFVLALGDRFGVKVFVERFETEEYGTEKGVSVQMAARDLRYAWFRRLSNDFEAKIAIAHHANDVAETMLFNLAKGTGLAGLHGIAEHDGIIIRPLLWARREEIEDYARRENIAWREDLSNESEKYMRNIIRKKVVPELERVNSAFIATNMRNAARIRDAERFIEHSIEQLGIIESRAGSIYIDKHRIAGLPGCEAVLYQLIKDYGFSYDQVKSITKSLGSVGAIFASDNWILNVDRAHLIITKKEGGLEERTIGQEEHIVNFGTFSLQMEQVPVAGYTIVSDYTVAAFDLEKLTFPLRVRSWQKGDGFIPIGMKGRKKVSDLLIDEKIPVSLKRDIPVLISGADIAWVVGMRIDDRFKITADTKTVCQIKYLLNQ
jgi:tRNA(Ile)-lysidine synthase